MNSQPKISVIVPVYKVEKTLDKCGKKYYYVSVKQKTLLKIVKRFFTVYSEPRQ